MKENIFYHINKQGCHNYSWLPPSKKWIKVQEEQYLQTAAICHSQKWTSNLRIQCEPVSSKGFQEEYLLSGYRHSLSKGHVKKKKKEIISVSPDTCSKVMLKILQGRLQQYVNWELPDVQVGLEKAEEPEIKLPTSFGS